jgi:hypothetical protein
MNMTQNYVQPARGNYYDERFGYAKCDTIADTAAACEAPNSHQYYANASAPTPTDAPSKAPTMHNPPSRAAPTAGEGEDAAIALAVISLGFAGIYYRLRTARVRKEQQLLELSPFEQVGGL